jgi:hypothetical protein
MTQHCFGLGARIARGFGGCDLEPKCEAKRGGCVSGTIARSSLYQLWNARVYERENMSWVLVHCVQSITRGLLNSPTPSVVSKSAACQLTNAPPME